MFECWQFVLTALHLRIKPINYMNEQVQHIFASLIKVNVSGRSTYTAPMKIIDLSREI